MTYEIHHGNTALIDMTMQYANSDIIQADRLFHPHVTLSMYFNLTTPFSCILDQQICALICDGRPMQVIKKKKNILNNKADTYLNVIQREFWSCPEELIITCSHTNECFPRIKYR